MKEENNSINDKAENPFLNFQLIQNSFPDKADIDHFFADVEDTFPSVGSFGDSWESAKIRRKRDVQNNLYFPEEPLFDTHERSIGTKLSIGPAQDTRKNNNDASGTSGFGGRADFETDFHNLLNGETQKPYLSLLHGHQYGTQGDKGGEQHRGKTGDKK